MHLIVLSAMILPLIASAPLYAQKTPTPKARTTAIKVAREFDLEHARTIPTGDAESDAAEPLVPEAQPFTLPKPKYPLPTSIQNMIMFTIKTNPNKSVELRDEYKQIHQDKKALREWLMIALVDAWNYENASEKIRIDQASNSGNIARMLGGWSKIPRNIKSMYAWNDYVVNGW